MKIIQNVADHPSSISGSI